MTTEFGTRAMLDVTLKESSVRDAKQELEDRLGGFSVRATAGGTRSSVSPLSDGGRSVGGGIRETLTEQTDVLVQIRDAIEEGSFAAASGQGGGGGTTIISGGGALGRLGSAAGTVARAAGPVGLAAGAGYVLQDQLGKFEPEKFLGLNKNPLFSALNGITGGGAGAAVGLGNILLGQSGDIGEALGLVDDADAFEQSLIDGARSAKQQLIEGSKTGVAFWTKDVPAALSDLSPPSWVTTLMNDPLTEPQWLSSLTSYQLSEPKWLSDLTSFRLQEPQWVGDLRSLLGGGGGGGGGGPPAGARTPAGPVNTSVDVGVQIPNVEREFQRAARRIDWSRIIEPIIREAITG
jgi:hypothetical protein